MVHIKGYMYKWIMQDLGEYKKTITVCIALWHKKALYLPDTKPQSKTILFFFCCFVGALMKIVKNTKTKRSHSFCVDRVDGEFLSEQPVA